MEWRDLPPGRAIPQATALNRHGCRDLVMGKGAWAGAVGSIRTKLQHLAANLRWTARNGGDRLNHPRYRDFATIPAADFLQ